MKKITILLLLFGCNSFAQVEFVTDVIVHGVKVNDKMVFMNYSEKEGKELWVSDGTSAGTHLLRDIKVGPESSTPYNLTLLDGVVYFQANSHQIWRTDGTSAGTYVMVDNNLVTNPFNYVKTKDFIFFYAGASGFNCCKQLWRMNINPNSENLVTPENNFVSAEDPIVFDYDENVILFNAKTYANEWAIWRTNGGVSLMVKDLTPKKSDAKPLNGAKLIGSEIYFSGFTTEFGPELWKTKGELDNTEMVKDIYVDENYFNGSSVRDFIKIGANLYFTAKDNNNGLEVWKTDGTEAGTQMIKDINPGNNYSGGAPGNLTEFNGMLYFTQFDSNNSQIWKTNGTEAGTVKVIDVPNTNVLNELFAHNGNLYFGMETPEAGTELWKLDADDNLTFIKDIFPGTEGSFPGSFFELNGDVYFTATSNGLYSGYGTYKIGGQSLNTNTITNENEVFVYPNPTTGSLNVTTENKVDIDIFDLLGKKVRHFKNQKTIDISNLKSGIYLMKTTDLQTNKTFAQKIIKQ